MSAKLKLSPPPLRGRLFLFSLLGFFFLCGPLAARADSLEDAARALARKAASSLHGIAVACAVQNSSSLPGKEFSSFSAVFQEELQQRGVKVLSTGAPATILLTVTENSTAYVGVLQIQRKEIPELFMEVLGPIEGAPVAEPMYSLVLHKEFLFSQDAPVLDVFLGRDSRHASALGFQGITSYELQGDRWILTGAGHLPVRHPSDRAPRGFLFLGIDAAAAYLPGEVCTVSMLDAKGWSCEKNRDQTPVRSVSQSVFAGKKVKTWFSAAQFGPEEAAKIVVTGLDGLARLYEEGPDPVSTFPGWGSEIASVHSGCGSGWQLLVTGNGDLTRADTLQAVEIRDRRAQPVSAPIELTGAVTALHTPGMRTADDASANTSAVAVVHNLHSGLYEVYRLTISCPN